MSVSCSLAWNKTTVDSCHFKSSISYNVTEEEVTLKTLLHMQFYCPIKTGSNRENKYYSHHALYNAFFGGNKTQVCYSKESQRLLRNNDWEGNKN